MRRALGSYFINPVTDVMVKAKLRPNQITLISLVPIIAGSVLIVVLSDYLWVAGLLILLGSLLDVFDGSVARRRDMVTAWGAFLDSTTDRIQEFIVLLALAVYFLYVDPEAPRETELLLTVIALFGSLFGSYLRGKAEFSGIRGTRGLVTRTEKVAIVVLFLLLGLPGILVWVLAIATILGSLYRLFVFWRELHDR